jgi:hypothetical protein
MTNCGITGSPGLPTHWQQISGPATGYRRQMINGQAFGCLI